MASRNGTVSTGVALHMVQKYRIDELYASLNGALGLDDVELIKRETNLVYRRVVLRVACVFTGISNFRYIVGPFDCSLLMMDYVSVSLFFISVLSAYFAHFVAHFISSRR